MPSIQLDSQSCAILADSGPLGRHSRQDLAAKLRKMGRKGRITIVDAADGEVAVTLSLGVLAPTARNTLTVGV